MRKQDRMLQDLVTATQEPVWVDPTILADVTLKKRDGRDAKGTDAGEIPPEADAIEKIVASEDRVMQADDGTKILVKAGHTLALETKDGKPLYHQFVLFPGQHDFLESGVLATIQEVQAEQEVARRRMTLAEELSFTATQAATIVTPERPGDAANVVRGTLPVRAKAASLTNVMPKTGVTEVQEPAEKGATTGEGAKAASPPKSPPKIVRAAVDSAPHVAPETGGDITPSMETVTAKGGPAQLVSYATSENGEGSGSGLDTGPKKQHTVCDTPPALPPKVPPTTPSPTGKTASPNVTVVAARISPLRSPPETVTTRKTSGVQKLDESLDWGPIADEDLLSSTQAAESAAASLLNQA